MMLPPRLRLGELLVEAKMISEEDLQAVLALQRADGRRLGTLLVDRGLINETQLTQILSHQLSVPWVSLLHIEFSRQLLNLVPHDVADRFCLVPIYVRHVRHQGETLYIAMDDPTNEDGLRACQDHSGLPVRSMIAPPSDIRSAIRVYYGGSGSPRITPTPITVDARASAKTQASPPNKEAAAGSAKATEVELSEEPVADRPTVIEVKPAKAPVAEPVPEAADRPTVIEVKRAKAVEAEPAKATEAAPATVTEAAPATVTEAAPIAAASEAEAVPETEAVTLAEPVAELSAPAAEPAPAPEEAPPAEPASEPSSSAEPASSSDQPAGDGPRRRPYRTPPEMDEVRLLAVLAAVAERSKTSIATNQAEAAPRLPAWYGGASPAQRLRGVFHSDAPPPSSSRQVENIPAPKGRAPRMVALTLLDGTKINLPAKQKRSVPPPEEIEGMEGTTALEPPPPLQLPPPSEPPPPVPPGSESLPVPEEAHGMTARDLVLALRAVSHGADASEVLSSNFRWESMFAALLSLLLKKHLIADWEFVDELKKKI